MVMMEAPALSCPFHATLRNENLPALTQGKIGVLCKGHFLLNIINEMTFAYVSFHIVYHFLTFLSPLLSFTLIFIQIP